MPLYLNNFIYEVMVPAVDTQILCLVALSVGLLTIAAWTENAWEVVLVTAHSQKLTCLKVQVCLAW